MRRFIASRPSPAMAVAFVALLAALSGTAVALPGRNSVDSGDLKNGAVTTKDIKNNNVRSGDVRNGSLTGGDVKNDSLTGLDINEGALGTVPNANHADSANSATSATSATSAGTANSLAGLQVERPRRVTAAEGATDADARAAAPKIPLFSAGPLSVYGKCFRNTATDVVFAEVIGGTTEDGVMADSRNDDREGDTGNTFLNVATLESDSTWDQNSATNNNSEGDNDDDSDFSMLAPSGAWIRGFTTIGAKNGTLSSPGPYGAGDNVCIFGGWAFTGTAFSG
jgi:hypothetical protein